MEKILQDNFQQWIVLILTMEQTELVWIYIH